MILAVFALAFAVQYFVLYYCHAQQLDVFIGYNAHMFTCRMHMKVL